MQITNSGSVMSDCSVKTISMKPLRMSRMCSDDLQMIRSRNRSPPHSPFLATLLRRQSRNEHPSQIKFKEQRRIVVLGSAKVGKSAIIQQFLYDEFPIKHRRTVEDLHVAEYNLSNGASLTLEILDTTGSYQFPAMRALSLSNGSAFLLVYSVDSEESWKEISELRHQIICARGPDVPIVIAANIFGDGDNERIVKREVVDATVKRWRCGYVECNAKQNSKVVEVFARVLVESNIEYDLNEAVCRRRRSFPVYSGSSRFNHNTANACSIS